MTMIARSATSNSDELIAGFQPQAWQAFMAALQPQYIEKDPNGKAYVRHQVCTDSLNRCFGPDGWRFEVKEITEHDPYKYTIKDGTAKDGRFYAVALVRLTIGRNGFETYRENCGAQVSAGTRDDTRKGAVSEALKRAASLFGWAPNVYMTEQLAEDWVGDTIMREKKREAEAGFSLPQNHETQILEWLTSLGMPVEEQRKVIGLVDCRASAYALATAIKHLCDKPAGEVANDGKLPV